MSIFGRCHRSSAAVTPAKYECDTKNLTGSFVRSKILLTEKLTNGALVTSTPGIDKLAPEQNGRHFADGILKHILLKENMVIMIEIPPSFVPGGLDTSSELVKIMAWHRTGDKL